jgi:O-antigen/teichoic acid export membrane protein
MKRFLQHPLLASFGDIVASASSLVGTTAVTALLGFVYWWVAARLFAPEEVGFAAASISAMQLLGALGVFGCGTLLIGELQRRRDRDQKVALIVTTLAATGLLGVALGTGFALIAPFVASDLRPLAASRLNVGLFALGVGLTAATLVLDQAVLGLQRGGLQLWRNAIFAVVKLLALVPAGYLLARTFALGIYATWAGGLAVSLLWLAGQALWRGLRPRDCLPRWGLLRGLGKSALEHHFLNLALQAPGLVMPMIVTATLSSVQNAYFYTAWMVVGFVYVPPIALSIALFAAAASDPEALARRLRFTLKAATAFGLAANLVLLVGARSILGIFGAAADHRARRLPADRERSFRRPLPHQRPGPRRRPADLRRLPARTRGRIRRRAPRRADRPCTGLSAGDLLRGRRDAPHYRPSRQAGATAAGQLPADRRAEAGQRSTPASLAGAGNRRAQPDLPQSLGRNAADLL